ncbi:MAG: hypothetical protein ABSG41_21935 [Bryobacteraceae bacterium]|jgi:Flp pilus assembly pilin Flp
MRAINGLLRGLLRDEQGQDLIEYTLLVSFIALASAALFLGAGGNVSAIWGSGAAVLNTAAAAATPGASSNSGSGNNGNGNNGNGNGNGNGDNGHGDGGHGDH